MSALLDIFTVLVVGLLIISVLGLAVLTIVEVMWPVCVICGRRREHPNHKYHQFEERPMA